jgi:hypothetical protein
MHHAKLLSHGFASLLIACTLTGGSLVAVHAQQKAKQPDTKKKPVRTPGSDPFLPYEPPRVAVKRVANPVTTPPIEQRIEQYRAQKQAAMNSHMPAPKPTTALLLGELQVVGITRTPRGYAAIVEAMPIRLTYVVYPGEKFYDGQLVAIEDARLVFRHETVFTDGKRAVSVETKSLRQVSMTETMTVAKPAADNGAEEKKPEQKTGEKSEQKPSTPEKP